MRKKTFKVSYDQNNYISCTLKSGKDIDLSLVTEEQLKILIDLMSDIMKN